MDERKSESGERRRGSRAARVVRYQARGYNGMLRGEGDGGKTRNVKGRGSGIDSEGFPKNFFDRGHPVPDLGETALPQGDHALLDGLLS